jgi:hypothetical protein
MSSPTRNHRRGTSPKKLTYEEMRFSVSTGTPLNAFAVPFRGGPIMKSESIPYPTVQQTPQTIKIANMPEAPRKPFRSVSPKKDFMPFPIPPPFSMNEPRKIDETQERLESIASLISAGIKKDQLVKILSSQKYPLPLHLYKGRTTMLNLALEVSDELANLIFSLLPDFTNEEMSLKFAILHRLKTFATKLSEKNINLDLNTEDNCLVLATKMKMHNVVSNILEKIKKAQYIDSKYPWNGYKLTLIHFAILNDDESTLATLIEHGGNLSESLENKVVLEQIKQKMSPDSKLFYLVK